MGKMVLAAGNTLSRYLEWCPLTCLYHRQIQTCSQQLAKVKKIDDRVVEESEPASSPTPDKDVFRRDTLISLFCIFLSEIRYKLIVEYATICQRTATILEHRKVFLPLINCFLLLILSLFKENVFTGSKQMISLVKSLRLLN